MGAIIADRYHVKQKLGEGGMGEVYLAEHVRIRRKVAVKVMRKWMAGDPAALGRFHREAENASQISHPNVATVYDFGETGDGIIYFAMEYIDGEPLSRILDRERHLGFIRTIDVVRQTADALHAAHSLGILHRDLKPDNIMVGRTRAGTDQVKLVDFGISRVMDRGTQQFTSTGMIVGTPDYMSPEQLSGDALDHRADNYALALIAFRCLTGASAFGTGTATDSLVARLTKPPRRLDEANPEVSWPEAMQAVFDKALAASPDARFNDAMEFTNALDLSLTGLALTEADQAYLTAMSQRMLTPPRGGFGTVDSVTPVVAQRGLGDAVTPTPTDARGAVRDAALTPTLSAPAVEAASSAPTEPGFRVEAPTPAAASEVVSGEAPTPVLPVSTFRSYTEAPTEQIEGPVISATPPRGVDSSGATLNTDASGADAGIDAPRRGGRRGPLLATVAAVVVIGAVILARRGGSAAGPAAPPDTSVVVTPPPAAVVAADTTPSPADSTPVVAADSAAPVKIDAALQAASRTVFAVASAGGSGAGFLADTSGLVVTSASLVSGGGVTVRVDAQRFRAPVVSQSRGLAVLLIPRNACRGCAALALTKDSVPPAVGDSVYFVGSPAYASGRQRRGTVREATAERVAASFGVDARHAGSPVLNARGEVVGVANRAGDRAVPLVSAALVRSVLADARSKRGSLSADATPLPSWPNKTVTSAMRAAGEALTERDIEDNYRARGDGFEILVMTPQVQAWRKKHGNDSVVAPPKSSSDDPFKIDRTRPAAPSTILDPIKQWGAWSDYFSERRAVVMLEVSPEKIKQPYLGTGRAVEFGKGDVESVTLKRDEATVTPIESITYGAIPDAAVNVRGPLFHAMLNVYAPSDFGTGTQFTVMAVDKSGRGRTVAVALPPRVIARVRQDLAGYIR